MSSVKNWMVHILSISIALFVARQLYDAQIERGRPGGSIDWVCLLGESASLVVLAEGGATALKLRSKDLIKLQFYNIYILMCVLYMINYMLIFVISEVVAFKTGQRSLLNTYYSTLLYDLLMDWEDDWKYLGCLGLPSLIVAILMSRTRQRMGIRLGFEFDQFVVLILCLLITAAAFFREGFRVTPFH